MGCEGGGRGATLIYFHYLRFVLSKKSTQHIGLKQRARGAQGGLLAHRKASSSQMGNIKVQQLGGTSTRIGIATLGCE